MTWFQNKWVRLVFIIFGFITVVAATAFLSRFEILRRLADLPPFTHRAGERYDVMVAMEDGVELYTIVQVPRGDGPFPTVLVRSPYAESRFIMREALCGPFIRYGYACVYQDVRARGNSEGEWDPGVNDEITDGRDTLNWLVEQDFQDGNIAMVGSSYLSTVQYSAVAGGAPPELKTIVPSMVSTDIQEAMYQDGMFRHELYTAWAGMMRDSESSDANPDTGAQYQEAILYRPHNEVDTEIYGVSMPWYQDMIAAASPSSDYWQRPNRIQDVPESMTIPILMIGGYYDAFFGPQLDDWHQLATQSDSLYIVGPWTHSGDTGELETPNAEGGQMQYPETLAWLNHHLKGEPLELPTGISLYVMGTGEWIHRDEWPTATDTQTFYLSNLESANECSGGELASDPGTGRAVYTYDPNNPVPTRGGAGMLAYNLRGFDGAPPANVNQSGLCEREDVLTFQSEPFEDGLLISGAFSVTLDVSSSAPDTAFTAKLIEVFPDGRTINIRDSVTTLAYRNGSDVPLDYQPGDQVSVTIDFWPIVWQMQPGSVLRLDISSSDFPKFHAHTNRAGPWAEQTGADIATQTVYGGTVDVPVEP